MATKLDKAVPRESATEIDFRPLLVTLQPADNIISEDVIAMKPKGLGKGASVHITVREAYAIGSGDPDWPRSWGPPSTVPMHDPVMEIGPDHVATADGTTPYRISGKNLYIGETGPWITEYGSGVYVSETLLQLRK